MKLYYADASPFARKVRVLAYEIGITPQIEIITINPWDTTGGLAQFNPLNQVPTLITDDNVVLYDSTVICEYLDNLHTGEKRIPTEFKARIAMQKLQALANGMMNAAVLQVVEVLRRPEALRWDNWIELQRTMRNNGLQELEKTIDDWSATSFNLGQIAVACSLGYFDFRLAAEDWRATCPRLAQWYAEIAQYPAMQTTKPVAV